MSGRLSTEQPRWSPDGKAILFTTGATRIYVLELPGARVRFLASGHDPEWSPDGRRVAFVRLGADWQIAIAQADGSGEMTLATLPQGIRGRLAWHPDGHSLLCVDGSWRPLAIDVATGKPVPLEIPAPVQALAVSPCGQWVAFTTPIQEDAPGSLHLYSWRECRTSLLAEDAPSSLFWARGGRTLFAVGSNGTREVLRCDAAAGTVETIRVPQELRPLAPAPDGGEMLYAALRVPGDLMLGEMGGSRLRTFVHGYLPVWSPDGKSVAFFDSADEEGGLCTQHRSRTNFARWTTTAPAKPPRERAAEAGSTAAFYGMFPGLPALAAMLATQPFLARPGLLHWVLLLPLWAAFFIGYRHSVRWARSLAQTLENERVAHALAILPAALLAAAACTAGLSLRALWFPLFAALWVGLLALAPPALSRRPPGSRRALFAAWVLAFAAVSATGLLQSHRRAAVSNPRAPAAVVEAKPARALPEPGKP